MNEVETRTFRRGGEANEDATPHRILVVEDDADTRRGLEVRLSAHRYETCLSHEGDNAVALAQKTRPDLILLDLGLPGVDGLCVLERLRVVLPQSRVIVLSAWDERTFAPRALAAGARLYLQKPVADDHLLAAIRSVLDED